MTANRRKLSFFFPTVDKHSLRHVRERSHRLRGKEAKEKEEEKNKKKKKKLNDEKKEKV